MNNNICLLTDTHFGFENNSEQLLESSFKFFNEVLVPFLKKNEIDKIFMLGDVFDSRTSVNTRIQNAVYDLFDVILKDFTVYVLVGNHDIYYNSTTEVHSLKFLRKFENVNLIEKPELVCGDKILMIPWVVDDSEIAGILDGKNAKVLMGHFDIAGFGLNKYISSKNGINPDLFINKFKTIFSGHFHTRSVRDIGDSKFIYVGTPYQLTRADIDEERGFLIYNLRSHKHKFFSNNVSTKFVALNYPDDFSQEMIENNKIDVNIMYDHETYSPEEYTKYIEDIEKYNPIKITPFYIDTTELESELDIKNQKINISSIPDLIKGYVEALGLSEHDKEEIYNILVRLYDKANNNN